MEVKDDWISVIFRNMPEAGLDIIIDEEVIRLSHPSLIDNQYCLITSFENFQIVEKILSKYNNKFIGDKKMKVEFLYQVNIHPYQDLKVKIQKSKKFKPFLEEILLKEKSTDSQV